MKVRGDRRWNWRSPNLWGLDYGGIEIYGNLIRWGLNLWGLNFMGIQKYGIEFCGDQKFGGDPRSERGLICQNSICQKLNLPKQLLANCQKKKPIIKFNKKSICQKRDLNKNIQHFNKNTTNIICSSSGNSNIKFAADFEIYVVIAGIYFLFAEFNENDENDLEHLNWRWSQTKIR